MRRRSGILFGVLLSLMLNGHVAEARPVVVVLAQNDGTEITDFMVPYGVIASADVADVIAVAPEAGRIDFMNGLAARVDTSLAVFDEAHPVGAQYVIIPAMHDGENPAVRNWLKAQSAKGAVLVSICDGAFVLAGTGLLDGRTATGHFYSYETRREDFPKVNWVRDMRYVSDGKFVTTSGVSASMPAALYVVELIAGREVALKAAQAQGLTDYSTAHDSAAFFIGWRDYAMAAWSYLTTWPRDAYVLEVSNGVDEVAVAFAGDMLPRTYRARVAFAGDVTTKHGLHLLRNEDVPEGASKVMLGGGAGDVVVGGGARAAEDVTAYLRGRYGAAMAQFVAAQMEYAVE